MQYTCYLSVIDSCYNAYTILQEYACRKEIYMKKILLLTLLFTLSGCSYFTSEPESVTTPNQETQTESQSEEVAQEATESTPANNTFDNVFNETVIGQDRYPATTLPDSIPISDLRVAIDEFYTEAMPEDEKEMNYEKIDPETIETLQETFSENEVYEPLDITVDQISLELGGETNYIARIVVGMPYEEAEDLIEEHDILVLNEALSQLENRLVLLAHYDGEADTLTPYHLNNSTTSIFSLADSEGETSSDSE